MDKAKKIKQLPDFLQYIVSIYGKEIYCDKQKLSGLIQGLYSGEEREKRLFRRAILEDAVSEQIYTIVQKDTAEAQHLLNQLRTHFCELNFYSQEIGEKVIDTLVNGLSIHLKESGVTKLEKDEGVWVDDFGVKYSADRRILISMPPAFEGHYQIASKCEVIGANALYGARNLTGIKIPDGLTSIEEGAFRGWLNLKPLLFPKSNNNFVLENGMLISLIDQTLIFCSQSNASVKIPANITRIGDYAFSQCRELTNIDIPSSVTAIGNSAFEKCTSLTSIVIPGNVTKIGNNAFDGCYYVANFTIANGVTNIGDYAFKGCKTLINIEIPNSVTVIGKGAFKECDKLKSIAIPTGVTVIEDYTFEGCDSLTSIYIPDSVTNIGSLVFVGCSDLYSISIPKGTKNKFEKLLPEYRFILFEE